MKRFNRLIERAFECLLDTAELGVNGQQTFIHFISTGAYDVYHFSKLTAIDGRFKQNMSPLL